MKRMKPALIATDMATPAQEELKVVVAVAGDDIPQQPMKPRSRQQQHRFCCPVWGWATLGLGLLTAAHWLYLLWRCKAMGQRSSARLAKRHITFYWVSQVAFWCFRQSMLPWYVPCSGGEIMSVPCLYSEQSRKYAAFYTLHIVLLCFFLFHWLIDLVLITRWTQAIEHGTVLRERWVLPVVVAGTAIFVPVYIAVNWNNCLCEGLHDSGSKP